MYIKKNNVKKDSFKQNVLKIIKIVTNRVFIKFIAHKMSYKYETCKAPYNTIKKNKNGVIYDTKLKSCSHQIFFQKLASFTV